MSIIDFQNSSELDIINFLRSVYHKTALGKLNGTTQPTRKYLEFFKDNPKCSFNSVLDYGCGKGRDEQALKEAFKEYTGYEPHQDFGYQNTKGPILNQKFDLVVCNYVLNIIVRTDREQVISDLKQFIKNGAKVLIGVRQDRSAVKDNWIPFQDGFISTRPTFQKFFSAREIKELFSDVAKVEILDSRGTYLLTPKIQSTLTRFF